MARDYEERFTPEPMSGCWLWHGTLSSAGYGRIKINGRRYLAHRGFYEKENGVIPDGLILRHTCDTPCCVNPDHLRTGTHADNTKDMFDRNRQFAATGGTRDGDRNPRAKLTPDDVVLIRCVSGRGTRSWLSEAFGVSLRTIAAIQQYQSWKLTP